MKTSEKTCKSEQCDRPVIYGKLSLCSAHYQRLRKNTDLDTPVKRRERHGLTESRTYRSWEAMITRCQSKTAKEYPIYGGRGIEVCARWHDSFLAFLEDMGERPEGLTLDRIDNNGNYEPSNCRWADKCIQQQNQRPSKRNKTGQRGVSWATRLKKYTASIQARGQIVFLGNFTSLDDAIKARKEAEIKYWSVS